MNLPKISEPLTATQLRDRVLAQLNGESRRLSRADRERRAPGAGEAAEGRTAVTPQARRELEQAFLRILRAREPRMVWTLLPDEPQAVLDRSTTASTGGGRDDDAIENGGE